MKPPTSWCLGIMVVWPEMSGIKPWGNVWRNCFWIVRIVWVGNEMTPVCYNSWYGWRLKDEQMKTPGMNSFPYEMSKWSIAWGLSANELFVKEKRVTRNDKAPGVWNEKSFAKKKHRKTTRPEKPWLEDDCFLLQCLAYFQGSRSPLLVSRDVKFPPFFAHKIYLPWN